MEKELRKKKDIGMAGASRTSGTALPELLAPAGGMRQLIAAAENGADAVYLGGPSFNARMQADNFTEADFREAVRYAHVRGAKIYVTMNTLLSDEDLPTALAAAERMYADGADGFIIQDLGLCRMLREHLPDAKRHLSTQASVYNLEGARTAAALGCERVVLARELTIAEIRDICAAGLAEIEVFVHGALCMCYSGQCQMSRAIGGRSANKGACAQPCRLPYRDETGRAAHFLSPKDMCQIDRLGELAAAGVRSLKIEGRMKSPEYVATVVRIYRKYLDLYAAQGDYTVSEEDRDALLQVFNREGFSDAYYGVMPEQVTGCAASPETAAAPFTGKDIRRMMALGTPKNTGLFAGETVQQKGVLADIRLTRPLEMGDVIEFRPRDALGGSVSATVTYLQPLGREKGCAIVRVGDVRDKVLPGDKVFLLRDASLMKRAREDSEPGTRKRPVRMRFGAAPGAAPWLTVTCGETRSEGGCAEVTVTGESPCEPAASKRPDPARIEQQLRKTGDTPFAAADIELRVAEDVFLPVSEVNRLRREALDQLEEALGRPRRAAPEQPEEALGRPRRAGAAAEETADGAGARTGGLPETACADEGTGGLFPADLEIADGEIPKDALRCSVITRGAEDARLAQIAQEAEASRAEKREDGSCDRFSDMPPVVLNNLGWITRLAGAGVPVYGGPGLNVTNTQAALALRELGVLKTQRSFEEWPKEELRDLMITEYPILTKSLTDRKGVTYLVEEDPGSRRHFIRRQARRGD